jgi:hypothetical protein
VRQVLAVVARGVPPATVGVQSPFFAAIQWKMTVSLVEPAPAALIFEVNR